MTYALICHKRNKQKNISTNHLIKLHGWSAHATYQIHMAVIHDYPHAFQNKSSQRGGRGVITTSFSVVSWQVDSATWTNFFLCATEKLIVPTLSITGGGYKSDYRNITNVIFPASRAAFAVYQCDIGDSCLLCSSEAEIHRFGKLKRTKAEKKKKGIEREKTIAKSGTSDLLRSPKHRQEQFHFEMYNVISISPFVPFRRFSSMCTREGVRPVRLSKPPLFELS